MASPILDYAFGTVPGTPGFAAPTDVTDTSISARTGVTTSVAIKPTTGLGTLSILRTAIDQSEQVFQLTAGTADPLDPTQIQPLDYDPVTNARYWLQIGGH